MSLLAMLVGLAIVAGAIRWQAVQLDWSWKETRGPLIDGGLYTFALDGFLGGINPAWLAWTPYVAGAAVAGFAVYKMRRSEKHDAHEEPKQEAEPMPDEQTTMQQVPLAQPFRDKASPPAHEASWGPVTQIGAPMQLPPSYPRPDEAL